MVSARQAVTWFAAILAGGLVAAPSLAASGNIGFHGTVPERGREALAVVAASPVSLSTESGLQFITRNAARQSVRRVFSVLSMDGQAMPAEILPSEAVMRPGAMRRVSVFVPFGKATAHRYRVCVESYALSGAPLGRVCQAHAARRVP